VVGYEPARECRRDFEDEAEGRNPVARMIVGVGELRLPIEQLRLGRRPLVDARIEQYRVEMRKQLKKTSPEMVRVEDIFGYSLKGWLIVETILENDRQANKEILGFFSIKGFYYQRLDRRLKPIIIRQLVEACQLLGNIWYSSWLQAGKPAPIIK